MAEAAARSLPQLVEAVWADPRQQVYAVMLGRQVPELHARLAQADIDHWDVLWTGELDADERAAAPVLVAIRRTSAFTDWLLGASASEFPGWGALLHSPAGFFALRSHARNLCRARLPNGQSIRIDWMDPEVLQAVLPLAGPDQLIQVFAQIEAITCLSSERWMRYSASMSRLAEQALPIV